MKEFMKKHYLLIILIIIQTIIYIITGINKQYLHIDEAFSFGLTHYDKVNIQDNEDFFNNWHEKQYYEEYLSVQKDEIGNYAPVYENQKNDVHPPLYYVFLRIAMELTNGHFSKWTGITLNIIIYAIITIVMYLILQKLFEDDKNSNIKSSILAFMSSIILASISNAVYIRMYALSTLNILITAFLHIKLLQNQKQNPKLLIGIGISVLSGILTHYYYIFYLFALYLVFFIKYIKEKQIKSLIYYTITILISGILSLIIFPYSIQHMFFGYRGQGVIDNFENIQSILQSILPNIHHLNYYVFNNLMFVIIAIIIGIIILIKILKKDTLKISTQNKEILKTIYIPVTFFFIMATIASPWKVLRYIVPVCGLIFVLSIYYLYKLLQTISSEKISNILVSVLFCIIIVTPFILHMEPELLLSNKKEIMQKLENELNLPTIYLFNTSERNIYS